MRTSNRAPLPSESSDAVGVVVALLERYPEIATIVSHPAQGTLTLSFAVSERIGAPAGRALRDELAEYVRALLHHAGERLEEFSVELESDRSMSFVRITRDVRSFSREELALLVTLLAARFGERLHRSPTQDDGDEDVSSDELVEIALEALREPESQRSLVGFREEKRVLVYFVKSRKKAKVRARP